MKFFCLKKLDKLPTSFIPAELLPTHLCWCLMQTRSPNNIYQLFQVVAAVFFISQSSCNLGGKDSTQLVSKTPDNSRQNRTNQSEIAQDEESVQDPVSTTGMNLLGACEESRISQLEALIACGLRYQERAGEKLSGLTWMYRWSEDVQEEKLQIQMIEGQKFPDVIYQISSDSQENLEHALAAIEVEVVFDQSTINLAKNDTSTFNSLVELIRASPEAASLAIVCGTDGNSCYSTNPDGSLSSAGTAAMSLGSALTPSGKRLMTTRGSDNFLLWQDAESNKLLKATGSDEWQMLLIPNGRSSGSTFADSTTISAQLAGRRCPSNVYIDDSNKVSTVSCLYFSSAYANQRLDAPQNDGGSDQTTWGSLRLGRQTSGKWYEGNIQTCANFGMRLPTIYETTIANFQTSMPTEIDAVFNSEKGIPGVGGRTWTATAHTGDNNRFWTWDGTTVGHENQGAVYGIRCVLP